MPGRAQATIALPRDDRVEGLEGLEGLEVREKVWFGSTARQVSGRVVIDAGQVAGLNHGIDQCRPVLPLSVTLPTARRTSRTVSRSARPR